MAGAVVGFGGFPFGFQGGSGGSGGGGGTGNASYVQARVGGAGGPVAGTSVWSPAALAAATEVPLIIVANIPENSTSLLPDFSFAGGTIDISPNKWSAGDAVIAFYK